VNLALGSNPADTASSFTINLIPTFQERGPNEFCMTGVTLPEGLNVTSGMNATVQVITNGDPEGGLYNVYISPLHHPSSPLSPTPFIDTHKTKAQSLTSFLVI